MRRNLFLYLALACFVGILAIFIVDAYLGIHDTVSVTAAEQQFTIGEDFWQQATAVSPPVPYGEVDKNAYPVFSNREDKISFRYEVDNRQFSTYEADIEVSVWHSQQKVRDLISQPVSISAFGKGESEWTIDNTELVPSDIPPEQSYNYTVIIKRGKIERRIVVSINPLVYR